MFRYHDRQCLIKSFNYKYVGDNLNLDHLMSYIMRNYYLLKKLKLLIFIIF